MDINLADPSNEEAWDDSMLIDSWNQALDEYKKYHSIHAKGGSIRDLEQSPVPPSKNGAQAEDEAEKLTTEETPNQEKPSSIEGSKDGRQSGALPRALPSPTILGSVRDEGLKKLLMSWYYAGYYTGLYEGQQQAQQQQQQQQQP